MTIAVDDILEVSVEHQLGAEHALNVMHYQVSTVENTDESIFLEQLIADLMLEWQQLNQSYMGEGGIVVCVTVQRISQTNPTRIYTEFGTGVASPRTKANGAQAAILLSKYPDAGEEPKNGRLFYPFPADELSQEGQIDADTVVTMLADFSKVLLDPVIMSGVGTVVSAIVRKDPILPAVISLVTDLVLRPVIATQQRRVKHHQPFVSTGP